MRRLVLLPLVLGGLALGAEPVQNPILLSRPGAHPTLVNPPCSHCRDEARRRAGELRLDDHVLCWIRDTKGRYDGGAIPIRFFLNPYRVISDTYGVFVYDPDAGYARGFAPSLDFTFHGWRNGVMVMKHRDGTLYSCLSGVAFDGPRKGTRLKPVATLTSNWGFWLKHYPGSVAYHMFDKYKPVELPTTIADESRKTRPPADPRLAEEATVLGVVDGADARAYPADELARSPVLHEEVAGRQRVVLWFRPTGTAVAYRPVAHAPAGKEDARAVRLEFDDKGGDAPFVDRETGSHFDIAGRAVDGKRKGWTLEWLDGTQVKWFAWAAEYPQTSIYGK